jgi:AraC-like DNA-binding protein
VERLLETIDVDTGNAWAGLAASLGWSDQSHMIRDFKRHTGTTPSGYLAARRSYTTPGGSLEAVRLVPERM